MLVTWTSLQYVSICFICFVMKTQRYDKRKVVKRYIKFLLKTFDIKVVRIVRQKAPEGVIRAIDKSSA